MALNLDHLHAFLVVIEEGSINRAATRLLRAQTAVGRQIKLLEQSFGIALFERTPNGVVPTEAGAQLIEYARRIFHNVAEAEVAMARAGVEPAGNLVVAIPISLTEQLGPLLVKTMQDRYPLIKLTLLEGDSHAVVQWINNGTAQIALLPDGQSDTSLHAIECGRQVLCFCGAADSLRNLPPSMPLAEALSYPLALSMQPNRLRQIIDRAAASVGSEVHPVLSTSSSHLITLLMRRGQAYTIRPRLGFTPAVVDGIAYIPLSSPEVSRCVNIVWSTAQPVNRATEAARSILSELMALLGQAAPDQSSVSSTEPHSLRL